MSNCEEIIKEKLQESEKNFQKVVIKVRSDITEAMEKKFGDEVKQIVENIVKEENLRVDNCSILGVNICFFIHNYDNEVSSLGPRKRCNVQNCVENVQNG